MIRNRILYAALFLLSLSFVYFYGGKIPYAIFYITLLLPVFSFTYTCMAYKSIRYSHRLQDKLVTKGDNIIFSFTVKNTGFLLCPYIKAQLYKSELIKSTQLSSIVFSLLPGQSKTFNLELDCLYRGLHQVGFDYYELVDFLGIFKFKRNIREKKELIVYPRIEFLGKLKIRNNYMSEAHSVLNSKYEDMTTISDVRKYTYGDSYKKIHWKLTARNDELMVKNYQSTSETSTILMLDLLKNPYTTDKNIIVEDKVIECFIAVTSYCLSNWIPVNIIYFDETVVNIQASTPQDFPEIYSAIAKMEFKTEVEIKNIMNTHFIDAINKPNIMIFTSNVNYGLYNEIYKAKVSGHEVSLIYILPCDEAESIEIREVLASLPDIGVEAYRINLKDDIRMILER